MHASFYTPYLDTLGGGERYVVSFAKVLADEGWSVDLESKDENILGKLEERFGLNLGKINTRETIRKGRNYDLCFWLSDGSLPLLFARKNILHFQRPFVNVGGRDLVNRLKLSKVEKIIVNSFFTKKWIDQEYAVDSIVLYPPCEIEKLKPGKKENIILSVGRFSQLGQSKRQDVLIDAFKRLRDWGYKDWRLIIAGGSEVGRTAFVDDLILSAKGYPIQVIENPTFQKVQELYSKAKIFWSASGYGVKEEKEPQRVEHFGITVVEAMAAEVVPLAYSAGGYKEIIKDSENGRLWDNIEILVKETGSLIGNAELLNRVAINARQTSEKYSYERFKKEVIGLI